MVRLILPDLSSLCCPTERCGTLQEVMAVAAQHIESQPRIEYVIIILICHLPHPLVVPHCAAIIWGSLNMRHFILYLSVNAC